MLISIETHITCDFPGGGGGWGVWTPYPPSLDLHMSNTVDMGLNPQKVIPKCLLAHAGDTINKFTSIEEEL